MKVYRKQDNLTIKLNTGVRLENITTALIKYIKPNGTQGQWTGVSDGTAISYNFTPSDLDPAGLWTVWVHITFADTSVSIGEASTFRVYEQGQ